mmetsp:Transcript_11448/g.25507  ORF Transcript_11448/g.25507 Transcript_11448/m.25507 type:complete len:206 (-) Transcript_11448:74-691(-)
MAREGYPLVTIINRRIAFAVGPTRSRQLPAGLISDRQLGTLTARLNWSRFPRRRNLNGHRNVRRDTFRWGAMVRRKIILSLSVPGSVCESPLCSTSPSSIIGPFPPPSSGPKHTTFTPIVLLFILEILKVANELLCPLAQKPLIVPFQFLAVIHGDEFRLRGGTNTNYRSTDTDSIIGHLENALDLTSGITLDILVHKETAHRRR